jgi:hypothetical protein
MNTVVGILFNTRRTFQKLDNEFIDDLNLKTSVIFCVSGLGTGIRATIEEWKYFVEPKIWSTALWLVVSCLFGLVIGRYIVSKVLFKIGKALKGKADIIDVIVVTAYSTIPLLIEVPIAIYKIVVLKGNLTSWDYTILNGLHLICWGLSIKILIQGLRDFNEYGTLKAVITISPLIVLPIFLYSFIDLLL